MLHHSDGKVAVCSNPSEFPDYGQISTVYEPVVDATIVIPSEYIGEKLTVSLVFVSSSFSTTTGPVMKLCMMKRGEDKGKDALGENTAILRFAMPLSETITGFFDRLKELTSGYASFEYEPAGYTACDVVKV